MHQNKKNKVAIVTGVTGQDGPYLSKLLLEKGYSVYGMIRRSSNPNLQNLKTLGIADAVELVEGDLCDYTSLLELTDKIRPHEIYNLAAMSHVATSFHQPEHTIDVTGLGVLRWLEVLRKFPQTKFYTSGSSEMIGDAVGVQNEDTPFSPCSPYAAAKILAHDLVKIYRESYKLFAISPVVFNHESPLRSDRFVTRKITKWLGKNHWLADIGAADSLYLGNLDAKRDWGFAGDYVEGIWRMLQQDAPREYVLGTGETYSVRDFCTLAFAKAGITITWKGEGVKEVGVDIWGNDVIRVDPKFYRPNEVPFLLADPTRAMRELGWKPTVSFDQLVEMMVNYDLKHSN